MNSEIIQHIKNSLQLSESETELFINSCEFKQLKKGEHFLQEGQHRKQLGFIIKGALYCYYLKNGEEVIDEFSLDNEFITDYHSFLTQSPVSKNVKCIEDAELLVIDFDTIKKTFSGSENQNTWRIIAEGMFLNWHHKAISLMLDDAETRYLKLIEKRADLIQRVPQYLIASYLNVKPETLSRIRKKVIS